MCLFGREDTIVACTCEVRLLIYSCRNVSYECIYRDRQDLSSTGSLATSAKTVLLAKCRMTLLRVKCSYAAVRLVGL